MSVSSNCLFQIISDLKHNDMYILEYFLSTSFEQTATKKVEALNFRWADLVIKGSLMSKPPWSVDRRHRGPEMEEYPDTILLPFSLPATFFYPIFLLFDLEPCSEKSRLMMIILFSCFMMPLLALLQNKTRHMKIYLRETWTKYLPMTLSPDT